MHLRSIVSPRATGLWTSSTTCVRRRVAPRIVPRQRSCLKGEKRSERWSLRYNYRIPREFPVEIPTCRATVGSKHDMTFTCACERSLPWRPSDRTICSCVVSVPLPMVEKTSATGIHGSSAARDSTLSHVCGDAFQQAEAVLIDVCELTFGYLAFLAAALSHLYYFVPL